MSAGWSSSRRSRRNQSTEAITASYARRAIADQRFPLPSDARPRKHAARRIVDLDEAVAAVNSGDRVYLHGGAATPHILLEGLVALRPELRAVEVVAMHTSGTAPHAAPEMAGRFRHNALFIGPNVREAVHQGRADYTPIFLSEIPSLFKPGGRLPLDVALIHVSPPDQFGRLSLGVSVDCALAATRYARVVVAQVNRQMPRTTGHTLHPADIDLAIEIDEPLPASPHESPGAEAEAIGRHVAALVEDGSTLQMGIGAIPAGVLAALTGHRDLGVHTEMFTEALLPLLLSGIVNGARKTVNNGRTVSAFVVGDQELYTYIHENERIALRPVDYTNRVSVIAAHDRMVAINSALSVDLTGQVVADSIGPRFYSGIGGQVDFIRGAAQSRGGKPIIALPSTAKVGALSRICPELLAGSGVVTTRGDVHWVVTEFGVANLHALTIRERARSLIALAHPNFRAELEDAAGKLGYLSHA